MQAPIALIFKIWSGTLTLFGISLILFFLIKSALVRGWFDSGGSGSLVPMNLEFLVLGI
jgi:hypothetical protein